MKAIAIEQFGGRDVMKMMDLPRPTIKPHEILVKIQMAGVNPVDWKIRQGLFEGRMPHEFPIILGWDAAGVVEAVGMDVEGIKLGDEVMAYCRKDTIHDGTYAEYIALEPSHVALKPKKLTFEKASVLPLAGLTAYQSLFESLKIQKGETILIHAGAGGVGSFAIQLAKEAGACVIATASPSHHQYVHELGANEVIDYKRVDFVAALQARHPEGLDAVFDTVGGETQKKSADVLKKGGRLTSLLAMDNDFFEKKDLKPGYVFVRPDSQQLALLGRKVEEGRLRISIASKFSFREAVKAHELQEGGPVQGKIVLQI
ncbi:MAG: NADP-dependent oxidoreductase [Deltaproteobacteria bacterium]|nr:NADP-dependent oxidoreductase [Deltaproteobacteria bacterium]